ncbi:MAG TPA: glycosyltransferase [Pyrinomonadaceae bacterium]|nr:glycosyltransferase [Pyrinomonadaceae bacterium]
MKIVRVIARLNVGGPAKHVAWLTAGLQDREWESLLVAGSVPTGEEDMGYFAEGLGVRPLLLKEMSREISLKDALTIWKLYRLFKREQPDVVHTHTAKAGTVGRSAGLLYRWLTPATLVGRPRRCHFVHTYHGHIFHGYYGKLKTRVFLLIEKLLARLITSRIVVVSEQQRKEIHETFGVGRTEQFQVIPLGLDLRSFAAPEKRRQTFRNELGVRESEILVGIVGRLTEIKNHRLFLRAVAKFKAAPGNEHVPVKFVVIGDGNLRQILAGTTAALGLSDDVIFVGSRKDPENFYAGLDVVALTSKNEGTPLTLIEAMANCIPVISTAVGGVVDLLGERDSEADPEAQYQICRRGVSVVPNEPDAFAAGLQRLVSDVRLRKELGARGREFVVRNYSRERLLDDIRALYRELTPSVPVSQTANVAVTRF